MKQVDFYLISNRVNDAKYKLASRLANKLVRLKQRILVITDNDESTTHLDTVMWSFNDTSFLAHDRLLADQSLDEQASAANNESTASAVLIGKHTTFDSITLEAPHDVLINLSSQIPVFNHHFARIAEIVEQDHAAKQAARKRYKDYQTEGYKIKTHSIEL